MIIASIVLVLAGDVQLSPGTCVLLQYGPGTWKYVLNTVPEIETPVPALHVTYVSRISIAEAMFVCGPYVSGPDFFWKKTTQGRFEPTSSSQPLLELTTRPSAGSLLTLGCTTYYKHINVTLKIYMNFKIFMSFLENKNVHRFINVHD